MGIQKLRELGVMIDCSRNAVVKLPALKDFIKICADFGYDYVGLYTEDTFEVTDEPYFGYQRGRYTQAEKYKEMIMERFKPKDVIIVDVFPFCGVNIGPGLMAAYYIGKPISKGLVEEKAMLEKLIKAEG